jgi:hypothetical protein
MRLDLLSPDDLSDDQRAFYDDMSSVIATKLTGFVAKTDDGALVGPFNPMLHFPEYGRPAWEYTKALIAHTTLPKTAHEVAILVVGAHFNARYELYAHTHVGEHVGLAPNKVSAIVAGQRPFDLTNDERVAYDTASALCRGGALPQATFDAAIAAFGKQGMAELAYLVGSYCQVSVLLNAYDVGVPDDEKAAV